MQQPEVLPRIGFKHAPASQFLCFASGVSSFTVLLLPAKYHHSLSLLWPKVFNEKQVWRLVTSQWIADSHLDAAFNCLLIYNFVVMERRWGTAKFISFLLSMWSLSLGFNMLIYKLALFEGVIPHIEHVPSGLFGPLFSLLVSYHKDIHQVEQRGLAGLLSGKVFVYIVCLQMMMESRKKFLISCCGLVSGVLYHFNCLKIQRLFVIPPWLSRNMHLMWCRMFPMHKPSSARTFLGATPEIQDDIVVDYALRTQERLVQRVQGGTGSHRTTAHLLRHDSSTEQPHHGRPSEENIEALVDMGFTRNDVIEALNSTNENVQAATSMLLSSS